MSPPQPRGGQRHLGRLGFFGGESPRSRPARCCHLRHLSSASFSPHPSTPSRPNMFPFGLVSGIKLYIGALGPSVHLFLFLPFLSLMMHLHSQTHICQNSLLQGPLSAESSLGWRVWKLRKGPLLGIYQAASLMSWTVWACAGRAV